MLQRVVKGCCQCVCSWECVRLEYGVSIPPVRTPIFHPYWPYWWRQVTSYHGHHYHEKYTGADGPVFEQTFSFALEHAFSSLPGHHIVGQTFSAGDWLYNFCMSEATFIYVCNELRSTIERTDTEMRKAVPVKQRVALTLWFLTTNTDYCTIGHLAFQNLLCV